MIGRLTQAISFSNGAKKSNMNNRYTLRVFHKDGYYNNDREYRHLCSDYNKSTHYDDFEVIGNYHPIAEVIYWNRIYKMQNSAKPIIPLRIEKWEFGEWSEIKFNPWVFKIVNLILICLPKSIRQYRRNWKYVRLFGA